MWICLDFCFDLIYMMSLFTGNFADAIEDMNSALAIDPCFASAEECKRQAEIDTCDKLDAIQQTGCKACA